ncbi:hypothetical protein FM107_01525 [Sphingobacterium sp. JB170]|nr:hypothetical protein FM107_01525 [Sphingobacterium sp. JB170]
MTTSEKLVSNIFCLSRSTGFRGNGYNCGDEAQSKALCFFT